jgi:hypothetical protein
MLRSQWRPVTKIFAVSQLLGSWDTTINAAVMKSPQFMICGRQSPCFILPEVRKERIYVLLRKPVNGLRTFVCLMGLHVGRAQCPRGLKHGPSSPAQTQASWVRILLEAWMSVCVYSMLVLSHAGRALRMADPPSKESCRLCIGLRNWKSGRSPSKGCRAIEKREQTACCRALGLTQVTVEWVPEAFSGRKAPEE